MAEWFYGKDGTQHGPASEHEIASLITAGQIEASTIIWREGMTDWIPLSQAPEFQSLSQQGATGADNAPYAAPQTNSGQAPYAGAPIPTDGLSIASLVCGVLAILASCMYIGFIFGIPGVICGHMSLKKIKKSPTPIQGKGMAIAGLVTGYIGTIISIAMVVFVVFFIGLAAMESSSASPGPGL